MDIKFPRPLKGWRVFAGEVGAIVLGVLLALGAQELVQSLHWSREVRETRKALDAELARDLAVFEYRMAQRKCVKDRVSELKRWMEGFRSGAPAKLKGPISGPPGFDVRRAVWEVTDGEIASRMTLQAKLNYAGLYDGMRLFDELRADEDAAWNQLVEYEDSVRLDDAELRKIRRLLTEVEGINTALGAFKPSFDQFAHELSVRPETNLRGRTNPVIVQWNKDLCTPLL